MNMYFIIGLVVIGAIACAGSAYEGHSIGVNSQKVADQKEFDRINKELADQKTQANALYRKAQDDNLALAVERDRLKTQLGEQDVKNRKTTADLTAKYTGLQLRYAVQVAGRGNSSSGAASPGGDSAGSQPPTILVLPDTLTAGLRLLATDADRLADDYRLCYGWANKIR